MSDPKVVTFFYGSYINPAVLREVDLVPDRIEVARLPGFDIEIRPLANLVPSDQHTVYGILATTTHAELERLYAHAREKLGGLLGFAPGVVEVGQIAHDFSRLHVLIASRSLQDAVRLEQR